MYVTAGHGTEALPALGRFSGRLPLNLDMGRATDEPVLAYPLVGEVDSVPGARRKTVEIIVTFTRLAPGSTEEREAVRQARGVWLDGQIEARGKEIEEHRLNRQGKHQLVAPSAPG